MKIMMSCCVAFIYIQYGGLWWFDSIALNFYLKFSISGLGHGRGWNFFLPINRGLVYWNIKHSLFLKLPIFKRSPYIVNTQALYQKFNLELCPKFYNSPLGSDTDKTVCKVWCPKIFFAMTNGLLLYILSSQHTFQWNNNDDLSERLSESNIQCYMYEILIIGL